MAMLLMVEQIIAHRAARRAIDLTRPMHGSWPFLFVMIGRLLVVRSHASPSRFRRVHLPDGVDGGEHIVRWRGIVQRAASFRPKIAHDAAPSAAYLAIPSMMQHLTGVD
jgi:hypothetical protein